MVLTGVNSVSFDARRMDLLVEEVGEVEEYCQIQPLKDKG